MIDFPNTPALLETTMFSEYKELAALLQFLLENNTNILF